ncbi:hypothetical protein TorRG33x02_284420 [Trema orientale]|uniref:Uncharacterized protein n=1 Tax=Trema orientale TaxID=63057 RepID=A0A2P5CHX1_TREOI|nr:hypothetical protein TorRG33x02_284420 [Trema orientale]
MTHILYKPKKKRKKEKKESIDREREANTVALGGKNDKQHTTNDTNPNRQRRKNLLSLIRRRWIKATHHILIKQSNGRKHEYGHQSMHEIDKLHTILRSLLRRERGGAVDHPQPSPRGETIAHISVLVPKTIREAEQKRGRSAQSHKARGHEPADRVALALVAENGSQKLESEDRPRR